jgi:hypothetical protein
MIVIKNMPSVIPVLGLKDRARVRELAALRAAMQNRD